MVCPNVIDGITGGITTQPFQFSFQSECLGNAGSMPCRARPNFIWTIHYYTESGIRYTEQWQDQTSGNTSNVRFYLYDRMPLATTPTSGQATQAGGNSNFSRVQYPNPGCLNNPYTGGIAAGEPFVKVLIECTGYSCGLLQMDESDQVELRYYNRRVPTLSIAGNPANYCRNQAYTINWSASTGATSYNVTASGGATISNNTGTSATLTLANVAPTTTSVTVSVTAVNSSVPCGTSLSAPRTLTLPVRQPAAQPANMQLNGGSCPNTTEKLLTIDAVPGVTAANGYRWTLVGTTNPAGTYLKNSSNQLVSSADEGTSIRIITPVAGTVTVEVKAKFNDSDCSGYGTALTKSFQITTTNPVCPTRYLGPSVWCTDGPSQLTISGSTALKYYPLNLFGSGIYAQNIQPAGARVTNVTQATPGSRIFNITLGANASGAYPTSFDLQVNVVSDCPTSGSASQSCLLHVDTYNLQSCGPAPCSGCGGNRSAGSSSAPALYPNPTRGEVNIQAQPGVHYVWMKLTNARGQVVSELHSAEAAGVTQFNTQALPTGLYQVQLFDGQYISTQRLIKD